MTHIDALDRFGTIGNEKQLLIAQHHLHMFAPGNRSQKRVIAAVDHDGGLQQRSAAGANQLQRLADLAKAGYRIDPGNDGGVRRTNDLRRPGKPRQRTSDQHKVVAPRNHGQEGVESSMLSFSEGISIAAQQRYRSRSQDAFETIRTDVRPGVPAHWTNPLFSVAARCPHSRKCGWFGNQDQ